MQHLGGLIKGEAKHIYIDLVRYYCSESGSASFELLSQHGKTKRKKEEEEEICGLSQSFGPNAVLYSQDQTPTPAPQTLSLQLGDPSETRLSPEPLQSPGLQ